MNSIIVFDDGAGTVISDGNITCTDLTGSTLNVTNVDTTNMTLQNLTLTGSINVPNVNDIGSIYGNVSFQNLGNAYLANNVYLNGYLLPYFNLSTTSLRMGLYSMRYQEATSTNNICFGLNAGAGTANTGGSYNNSFQKTIVIGNGAYQNATYGTYSTLHTDNVIIGNNSCKGANANNQYNVIIGSETCSSGNAGGSARSVIIGYGIGRTNGYYTDAVVIGANCLPNASANSACIIGSGNFSNATLPSGYANGAFVYGINNLSNATNFNSVIAIGDNVFPTMNSGVTSIGIGRNIFGLTTGYFNIFMGQSITSQGATTNSTSIGHNSTITANDNNTFLIGGNDAGLQSLGYTRYQDLCIKNKNRVLCINSYATASVVLTFELAEHIYITSATTTAITLPTPNATPATNPQNLGARFKLIRSTGTSNITINAPSGQTILFNNSASSTYAWSSSESYVELVCINQTGSSWAVSSSQQIATGGFTTGLSTNTINPYITANQCDLWVSSTASTINIGNQSTAQIINFSRLNTNSIEPKTVGNDLNLFTTTIASFLNFGNSGNYIVSRFYLIPTFYGATTFNGGITATATQTITFGTNAPTMSGANISSATIPYASLANDYRIIRTSGTYNFFAGTASVATTLTGDLNTLYGISSGYNLTTGNANSFYGSSAGYSCTTNSSANTAIGANAMSGFSSGSSSNNSVVGFAGLSSITTGQNNCGVGYLVLSNLTTGISNCFMGKNGGSAIVSGSFNCGIGDLVDYYGSSNDSSYCSFLGASSRITASGLSYTTCIGANTSCNTSNTIQLGSNGETVAFSGNLLSGSNTITSTQLGYLSGVYGGIMDLNSDQTVAGIKKYSTAISTGFQSLTGSGAVSFSLVGGKDVFLTGSGITGVILPTPNAANIGQVFVLIRNGITIGNSYVISTQVGTDRILVDGAVLATYQTSFSQASITVTAIATSGNCWVLSNFNNVNGLMMSKYIYPLFGGFTLPSNSSYADVNLISLGSNCLNANTNASYRNTAGCVYIGANVCTAMTTSPTGVTIIGNSGFIATTTGTINSTTAIGGDVGKLYAQTGTANTLLGFGADFTAASSFSNSTAIGTGALISASNVVVLGRTTETTIIPSAKVQYGGSYRPNSVFQTISANTDWNTTPPTNFPRFILFSGISTTTYTLTLPAISNANIFEGFEFQFRRTNTTASATTTSVLQVTATGTDTIYGQGIMTTSASTNVLPSGFYSGRLVCVNKTTTPYNWAYFT